ncbi:dTDP-4-keto-6-deoxy-D-glucose epimerase [Nocardia colli]|uniref:dTDP-4-keto-6-deoxy-D-glucose epimerase n=1 Tax=Nocardia colli TaxID=2545717 RepID=A0A5N0EHP5_9NOCA|nr:dTDP-4-dehydrorhamnose 3,5-epimerase [Nocardia colli]KAA8887615.1 dTDP-4-keto-6-deoxy-D-glucose epimerase [Nocardia colli]
MRVRDLAVAGALAVDAPAFADDRGSFATPLDAEALAAELGRPLFPVAQGAMSRSRQGVFRGVHYTLPPPGRAKFVWCAHGRCLDIVLDVRVGSPTFGVHEVLELDGSAERGLYLPIGVAHAFLALEDDTVMTYLLSGGYIPENEYALDPRDPALGLDLRGALILSERDTAAPTLAEAAERDLLPRYADCLALEP